MPRHHRSPHTPHSVQPSTWIPATITIRRRHLTRFAQYAWLWRRWIVAIFLIVAIVAALGVLRPPAPATQHVMRARHDLVPGQVITDQDVIWDEVAAQACPTSGLVDDSVIGTLPAIHIEPGTILTTSMFTDHSTDHLLQGQRLISISVSSGADLAHSGGFVDVVGAGEDGVGEVLATHARVVTVERESSAGTWGNQSGTKVTQITLAVSLTDASLIYGASTTRSLHLMVSKP